MNHPKVQFIQGDGRRMDELGSHFDTLAHPWLVIEDMHCNTLGVLRYFASRASKGDYILVEDSCIKRHALGIFNEEFGQAFRVDTFYTDFFGRNATCCEDSIFVFVK